MRGVTPRRRSQARSSAESYPLSARALSGRRRRGPRRERISGKAMNKGLNASMPAVLAAERPTTSGSPAASDSTWSLLPLLARSTGLGPVSDAWLIIASPVNSTFRSGR